MVRTKKIPHVTKREGLIKKERMLQNEADTEFVDFLVTRGIGRQ